MVGLVSGLPTGVIPGDLFTISTGSDQDEVLTEGAGKLFLSGM